MRLRATTFAIAKLEKQKLNRVQKWKVSYCYYKIGKGTIWFGCPNIFSVNCECCCRILNTNINKIISNLAFKKKWHPIFCPAFRTRWWHKLYDKWLKERYYVPKKMLRESLIFWINIFWSLTTISEHTITKIWGNYTPFIIV